MWERDGETLNEGERWRPLMREREMGETLSPLKASWQDQAERFPGAERCVCWLLLAATISYFCLNSPCIGPHPK